MSLPHDQHSYGPTKSSKLNQNLATVTLYKKAISFASESFLAITVQIITAGNIIFAKSVNVLEFFQIS